MKVYDPFANFQKTVLSNGLSIYSNYLPDKYWQIVGFMVHSGAKQDPLGQEGLSHFLEHFVFQKEEEEIRRIVYEKGGDLNLGGTSILGTTYSFSVPAQKTILKKVLASFGRNLFFNKLRLAPETLEKEKDVIASELDIKYSTTQLKEIACLGNKALYKDYWRERFPFGAIGNISVVRNIKLEDLQEYYAKHYTPANLSLVAIGGMPTEALLEIIKQTPLAANKKGQRAPKIEPLVETPCPRDLGVYRFPGIEASSFFAKALIPGVFSSRKIFLLTEMLKKKLEKLIRGVNGWSYRIDCEFSFLGDLHQIDLGFPALHSEAINSINQIINHCLEEIKTDSKLLEEIKKIDINQDLMIDRRGYSLLSGVFYNLELYQKIKTIKQYQKEIKKTTMADIVVLSEYLVESKRSGLLLCP